MEEQKQVVEKRVSRGVIRRRSKPGSEEKKAPQAAAPKKLTLDDKEVVAAPVAEPVVEAKPVVKAEPVAKVVEASAPKQEKDVTIKLKKAPALKSEVSPSAPRRKLTLDDVARKRAEANLKQNLTPQEQAQEAAAEAQEAAAPVEEAKPVKKIAGHKANGKVLSFKDRVKGTIDLDQFKNKPKPQAKEETTTGVKRSFGADAVKKDATTAKRVKKGVKSIGGDLDVDGVGRAANLSQYARTSATDRVFRPGANLRGRGRNKKKILSKKNLKSTTITTKKASKRVIQIDQNITVGNLAQELGEKASVLIKQLMDLGVMATINQAVDKETATLIAHEYKYEVKDIGFKEESVIQTAAVTDEALKDAPSRAPVVTIMGHVDHGKTSLLDAIRSANVTEGEAGGITQHIGAYTVDLPEGQITFIDTPGHEAFTTMRSRGAQVTDIVVLVVAADDGMMPQTEESIDHAKAAGVPIIVAVNKIDKEEANPDQIKRQLSEKGLLSEDWGGDVIFNEVSAITKQGIPELLESILLQSEILELKALQDTPAQGSILESKLDKSRGPVATLLVQTGSLHVGDYVVAGQFVGKVKAMTNWHGEIVKEALPSLAVEILGLEGVPSAGDVFNAVASEQDARKVAEFRKEEDREKAQSSGGMSLEDVFAKLKAGEISELNMILKADVQGSLEAVKESIMKIGNEEVTAKIIHSAVGGINESDVSLASASQAVIIGFNVRPETKAIHSAKAAKIDIKLYKVIYDLINEVKLAMEGLLAPDIEEEYLGRAEVRQTFEVSKLGTIAGCFVVDGVMSRNGKLRLLRDNVVVYEGEINSLKRFKDDAKEVKQGFECGIGLEGYKDIKDGDVIESYSLKEIKKKL